MDIQNIKEFLALAELGNYATVAENLFISQSSLSRHIAEMEQDLGVPLFYRNSRKVELSPYGIQFIPYARQIVELQEQYIAGLARTLKEVNGSITIGVFPNAAIYNITELLALFQIKYPNIQINLVEDTSHRLHEITRQGECDFAFIREKCRENSHELEKITLTEDTLVAVIPSGHHLAGNDKIRLEQLRDETFLLLPEHHLLYKISMDACRKAGFKPRLTLSGTKGQGIFDMVGHGLCVSLLMKKTAASMCRKNTVLVDVEPPEYSYINLIY
ncbi:MAG: LysR family transcriptional regulator, partial [Clostridiales bacterium]|nr:LysR family transcriptional regulator [Clostridiales bacterium]